MGLPLLKDGTQEARMARPMKLKALLRRRGLTAASLARGVRMADGGTMSDGTLAQLMNRYEWPRRTSPQDLISQINTWLDAQGVPAAVRDGWWEEDPAAAELRAVGDASPELVPPATRAKRRSAKPETVDEAEFRPENVMLTQAARKQFGLFGEIFRDVTGAEDVFIAGDQKYIREAMFQTARLGGLTAIVGESGSGKSVMRNDLLDRIARERLPIIAVQPKAIDKEKLTAAAICERIVRDLSEERPCNGHEARGDQVERILRTSSRAGNAHVLIIEEAHDLNVQTLKVLKRFWELQDGFRRLLGIVLIGQPELKKRLDERTNWGAREVIRRLEVAELLPLDGEVEAYLRHKLAQAQINSDALLAPDAYGAIRERLVRIDRHGRSVSDAYPLNVHNLVTRALNMAADLGAPKVDRAIVLKA